VEIDWADPVLDDLDALLECVGRNAPAYTSHFIQQIDIIGVVHGSGDNPGLSLAGSVSEPLSSLPADPSSVRSR